MHRSPKLTFEIQTKTNNLMNKWRFLRPRPFQWGKLFVSPGGPFQWIEVLSLRNGRYLMVFAVLPGDFTTPFLDHANRKMHKKPVGGLSNLACRSSGRNQQERSFERTNLSYSPDYQANNLQPSSQNSHHDFGHRGQCAADARATGQPPTRQPSHTPRCQHLDTRTHCHSLPGPPHLLPPD